MNAFSIRTFLFLPLLALSVLPAARSLGQTNHRGERFPELYFSKGAKGAEIVDAIGGRLPQVAAWHGKTVRELIAVCKRDKTLHMDRQGHLHYVCEGLVPQQNGVAQSDTGGGGSGTASAALTAADTFFLHSKPGASKVIYLDFDGHTTTGTPWNTNFEAGAPITTPRYSTDADTTSFTATELSNIQLIWQSVAEDYAPFDVDVTTEDPGVEALRKTSGNDTSFGVRVCIGGSSNDWYGANAGGVAYLGSFTWDTDSPVFVFPAQLSNGNVKYTAECISHEAGHSFGLAHDGRTNGTEYYAGHANWAPIMGVGYYSAVVQWSKGEYSLPNNTEDDTAIIAGMCSHRDDSHGNDIGHATALAGGAPTASGVIEKPTDIDVFGFSCSAGPISFTVTPATPSPNLDVQLALYDGAGSLITSVAPTTMGATLSATVPQGTYYLAVDGLGTGSPLTAYNDYGCLGQYSLAGTLVPPAGQPPVAVADSSAPLTGVASVAVNFSSAGSFDPDGTIVSYDWDFGDGATSTEANPGHTYTNPGTYTASLVVVDNSGLSSAADLVTVLVQSGEQPPIAVAGVTATTNGNQALPEPISGPGPLAVNFSSAGSYDPDGTIVAWNWNLGDGTTSTQANPSHTYTNPGTYIATLVVVDNSGASSSADSVTVIVQSSQQPPVAVADNSAPLSGPASLTVNFSSTGSSDPDGTIVGWNWNFGDGTTSTQANPSHVYTNPGTYTASLVVVDNSGMSSTPDTVTVIVQAQNVVYVSKIVMSVSKNSNGSQATARVTIKDQTGNVRSGVKVTGQWSGLTTGSDSKNTNSNGVASFNSTRTKTNGIFTFTVTNVTLSGFTYKPEQNVETTDSIATP